MVFVVVFVCGPNIFPALSQQQEGVFLLDANTFYKRSFEGNVELLQCLQHSDQRIHQ